MAATHPSNGTDRTAVAAAPRAAGTAGDPPREDTSHDGLMVALRDEARTASLLAKVTYMARTRYGIRAQDAQDIFNESVATYLTIHGRYPPRDNHFGILVGIFHRKALEHIGASQRTDRVAQRFVAKMRADRPSIARGEDPEGTVADKVIRAEDADLIRHAIASLSDDGRDMLLALAEGRSTRLEMIRSLGINRNTFDTRLRSLRLRLRKALETSGVL